MKFKYALISIMIFILCILNYFLINEYLTEYVPDNFDIKKLLDKKYRCIRFFDDKRDDRYLRATCAPYLEDYLSFKLEKSRYIILYYAHNTILISLIIIFQLLL